MSAPHDITPLLAPVFSGKRRVRYLALVALWLVAAIWFWVWWLNPAHVIEPLRYWTVTGLLGWITFLQGYFVVFLMRAVRPNGPDPQPGQYRVAMITTKTPAEPFSVARRTLEAMLTQDYPHDTWLADEDPDAETLNWCAANGVRICTRKGVAAYHRPVWPRRTRCKEGNLAYFYDHHGYENYDIVSQLDTDHVPQPGYLREILRPFADPTVGYVSAPSICASNAPDNWAARMRLDTEGAFHGILQAGYSNGFAPMCIGSHYAVRTVALKQVGGLGPELAEDHSTTMILNAGGWRGVHAIDAIAVGDGPASVADMVTQEFQWSRSLVTLLLQHTHRYLPGLPLRLKAQFLFCQALYPILALTYLAMYLIPILAVVFDFRYAMVTFPDYLAHALPPIGALMLIAISLRLDHSFRPTNARVISWERILFIMVQWPWVLWGSIMAVRDTLAGGFVDFRITPKGEAAKGRLPLKVLTVNGVLAAGCILPVLLINDVQEAQGFYLLTLFAGCLYTLALAMTVIRHVTENGFRYIGTWRDGLVQGALVAGLIALLSQSLVLRAAESTYALAIGLERLEIVGIRSRVAGAGAGAGEIDYFFKLSLR
ncbi:cellulose synthase (UDP-forming) [Roseovarius azorensis]|uniref:Cellulose synthase (UDP-forming) n=1 Tax=Roseovarius azorensis TaxID=1287727 RepID=A0A1H7KD95_9RHOB|nr:glycosyltransferase family 2 protein [Roseovarius azorensis]SEK84732.1 cellulose synthase (UDP-forming) [Roseovarius azorensis]